MSLSHRTIRRPRESTRRSTARNRLSTTCRSGDLGTWLKGQGRVARLSRTGPYGRHLLLSGGSYVKKPVQLAHKCTVRLCMCDERPFCHCSLRFWSRAGISLSLSLLYPLPLFSLSSGIGPTCAYEGQSRINLVTPWYRKWPAVEAGGRCPSVFREIGTPRVVEWIVPRRSFFYGAYDLTIVRTHLLRMKLCNVTRAHHLSYRFRTLRRIGIKRILQIEGRKEIYYITYL